MKPSRAAVINWVRRTLLEGHRTDGLPKLFVLKHLINRGHIGAKAVTQWAPKGAYDEPRLVAFADEMIQAAEAEAGQREYVQEYVLEAYCGQNTRASLSQRLEFEAVIPDDSADDDEFGNSPTTTRQASPQVVSNTILKGFERTLQVGTAPPLAVMGRMAQTEERLLLRIRELEARIDKMLEERLAQMSVYEELLSHKHERDLELRKVERREQMMEKVVGKVLPMVPAVINRMAGAQMLPGVSPQAIIIKDFLGALTPEEYAKIQAAVPADKLAPLMDMILAAVDAESAAQKTAEANT